MKKEFLQECIARGLSLERIGELVGRDPSTVSYHLRKHGLQPCGHDVHAPNGRVNPDELRAVINSGVTIREAAAPLGVGTSTIRYWLKRLGLETAASARRRLARDPSQLGVVRKCMVHGETTFVRRPDGGFRCRECRMDGVSRWRRRVKEKLVARAGGGCAVCGYSRYQGALQFHHLDPKQKSFSISREGTTRSFAEVAKEADKCVLLCANCHAEIEAGVRDVSSVAVSLRFHRAQSAG